MEKGLNTILSISVMLLLAACGGGGGSDTPTVSSNDAPPTTTTSTPTDSTTDKPIIIKANKQFILKIDQLPEGEYLVIDNNNRVPGLSNDIDKLIFSGRNYSYVQFGYARLKNGDVRGYIDNDSLDRLTKNMPITGTAIYKGTAFANKERSTEFAVGHSLINVDFSHKKLTGELTAKDTNFGRTINIRADITGNQFDGTASRVDRTAQAKGGFFGPNATEIGGVFIGDGLAGSFGGKKQ